MNFFQSDFDSSFLLLLADIFLFWVQRPALAIVYTAIFTAVHVSRSDFILKLAQLREHWQGAVQRADQRRSLVEGLVKHWHLYRRSLRKLQRFLSDTQTLLPPAGPARCSLQQLRRSLQDLQVRGM